MVSKYEDLYDGIVKKWERVTGRPGSFYYTAPETSSTISIVSILRDLEYRINNLEFKMGSPDA